MFTNWHRWVIAVLGAFLAVCGAFQLHAFGSLPVGWDNVPLFAAIAATFITALLPAIQDTTGPPPPHG